MLFHLQILSKAYLRALSVLSHDYKMIHTWMRKMVKKWIFDFTDWCIIENERGFSHPAKKHVVLNYADFVLLTFNLPKDYFSIQLHILFVSK